MSVIQVRVIVNARKHINYIYFAATGTFIFNNMKFKGDQIKIKFFVVVVVFGAGERERERQTDRQAGRQADRERSYANNCLNVFGLVFVFNGKATRLGTAIMDSFNY